MISYLDGGPGAVLGRTFGGESELRGQEPPKSKEIGQLRKSLKGRERDLRNITELDLRNWTFEPSRTALTELEPRNGHRTATLRS